MTTTKQVNTLWDALRDAIDQTYKSAAAGTIQANTLRDYARDISWSDDLEALLAAETANEREHRRNRPAVKDFSSETAAKLLLMHNIADGSKLTECPPATDFLRYRKTAVEAQVLGWLIRERVTDEWREQVEAMDYAKLMQEVKP